MADEVNPAQRAANVMAVSLPRGQRYDSRKDARVALETAMLAAFGKPVKVDTKISGGGGLGARAVFRCPSVFSKNNLKDLKAAVGVQRAAGRVGGTATAVLLGAGQCGGDGNGGGSGGNDGADGPCLPPGGTTSPPVDACLAVSAGLFMRAQQSARRKGRGFREEEEAGGHCIWQ